MFGEGMSNRGQTAPQFCQLAFEMIQSERNFTLVQQPISSTHTIVYDRKPALELFADVTDF